MAPNSAVGNTREQFVLLFDNIKDEVADELEHMTIPSEAIEWIKHMMDYTIPGGTLNLAFVFSLCKGK